MSEGRHVVRVDCHVHTVFSGDAVTRIDELAVRVAECHLDVVCITDHHSIAGAIAAAERRIGVRVVVGEEVRTPAGELIGLFLSERIPYVLPLDDVVGRIRAQGGVVYVPHPFDPMRASLRHRLEPLCARGAVDVVEVFNAKVRDPFHNTLAARVAARHALPGAAASDAHDPPGIGAAYVEMPDFDGPADFVTKLHEARLTGVFREHAPRFAPWQALSKTSGVRR